MTLTIDNIEDIAIGRDLSEVVELFNEALDESEIGYAEYWQDDEELVMYLPVHARVNESTIAFILAKMEFANIIREVGTTVDGDLLCVRFVDKR